MVVEANAERISAFTAIDRGAGIYLYAARSSDALALSQWKRAQSVRQSYDVLTSKARSLQWRFNLALFFGYHVLWPQGFDGKFEWPAALIAAAAAIALLRYRAGVIPVIACCALLGLGISLGGGL